MGVKRFAMILGVLGLAGPASLLGQVNVLTWHNDNARSGLNPAEAILTPQKVNSANFGMLFQVPVDGKVDAQPLYVSALSIPGRGTHNVVYVATEHDTVYAIDADNGSVLWQTSLLLAGETSSDSRNCGQITPEIGITSTPVIDLAKGFLYVVAMSKDASGKYYQRIHALWLTGGAEEYGSPVLVQASAPGTGDNSSGGMVNFDPAQYKDRPALLLSNNSLYTSWSSHCDYRPYTGWVISYDTNTGQQNGVFNLAPNGNAAATWNAGAGPAADAAGNVFLAAGNGTFDMNLSANGLPSLGDYGNAVVKLSRVNGILQPTDYWTMFDSDAESAGDTDLGSGGLMLLPATKDSAGNTRQLAVVAGKDTNMYVLDQTSLGHFNPTADTTIYQQLSGTLGHGMWSSPAYFNGNIYYGPVNSQLSSFHVANALVAGSPSSATPSIFAYPGVTPSISAYGTANGIAWAVENISPAVLHAYDANNLGTELYNSTQASGGRDRLGVGNRFIVPTVANGKVYVGGQTSVAVFGYLGGRPLADGDYNIVNQASNLILADYAASTDPNTEIIQYIPYGANYETWFLAWQGNGYYTIQNAATGMFLASPEGEDVTGIPAQHAQASFDDTELWAVVSSGTGYTLVNKSTNLLLTNPNGDPAPAGMELETSGSGAGQSWAVQPAQ